MTRADRARPSECSLLKLLFITFILPFVAALVAAVAFPDRPAVTSYELSALISMSHPVRR